VRGLVRAILWRIQRTFMQASPPASLWTLQRPTRERREIAKQ
jgi:hypothetical protein